ncbi:MAG: MFS transporter [Bryobacterales bacterium]|nr:MFS transporter [Bryobacterales bacterium]MDE0295000.1 MFS transporter [Bryobacterales bacterium]MDE0435817.1 MFS transporter [Bryobacterales bacterium]
MSTSTQQDAVEHDAASQDKMRWPVVCVLSLGMINAYFDRVCLTIALPVMVQTIELSPTQIGIALGAFFWSYTFLQIPSGVWVDKIGVRRPYFYGNLLWGFASAATALTTGLWYLLVIRILLGIGESVVTPSSMRYIRMHFEEKQRGSAVGLYMTGTKLGPAFGMPLAAFLITTFNWQTMFLIMGFGGLVILIPWMLWVKKDDIAAISRSQREVLEKEKPADSKLQTVSTREILSSPVIWGVVLGTFCYMYFVYYGMTWMPQYFGQKFGMSIKDMGWYGGVAFGGMAVMIWVGGAMADWFINRGYDPISVRKGFTILGFGFAATQTIGAYTSDTNLMLIIAVVSMWGLGFATANYWALTQTLIPGGSIAMVVGIQNTAANLAGIVSPTLTGWLIDQTGSFDVPIMTIGFWLLLGIVCYIFLVRRKYAPQPEQA